MIASGPNSDKVLVGVVYVTGSMRVTSNTGYTTNIVNTTIIYQNVALPTNKG